MSTIFVEFTFNGDRALINVADIQSISEHEGNALVSTRRGDYKIDQTYNQAISRLHEAIRVYG